jgi:hypothetical protein
MRHQRPELLAVAWIITGLLLLVAVAGVVMVTDAASEPTVRVAPAACDGG